MSVSYTHLVDKERIFRCDEACSATLHVFLEQMIKSFGSKCEAEVNDKDMPLFYERVLKKIAAYSTICLLYTSPLNYVDPSGHKISSLGDFVSFVQNKATEFRDKASSYIYEKATGALKGMLEWAKESCETLDCELVTVAYNILLGAGFALVENALNIIFSMKELGSQWD